MIAKVIGEKPELLKYYLSINRNRTHTYMNNNTEINSKVGSLVSSIEDDPLKVQQYVQDAMQVLTLTKKRLSQAKNQSGIQRFWSVISGETADNNVLNINDIVYAQKFALRYIDVLQDRQMLLAHSLLTIQSNLNVLTHDVNEMKYAINDMAHDINEIKSSITNMAQRIQHRFNEMDARIDELEMAQNILTWVNILKDEDLDKCPPRLRFIIVVRQFYQQKNDNWTMADLKLLRRALGEVGIDFKEEVSIGTLVSELINELDGNSSSIKKYNSLIYVDDSLTAGMVREEISIPSFISLTTLPDSIKKMASASEILSSHLGIDVNEASAKLVISNLEKHHGVCSEQTYDVFGLACQILRTYPKRDCQITNSDNS